MNSVPPVLRIACRLVCLLVLALIMRSAAASEVLAQPNILLIVADDLGYNDLAINNANPRIHTPALDQLAREGVRFTQHYADAVCSPARAALLSGMHPARLGYVPNGRGLSPQLLTLPEALRERGYRTVHVGKWHIGDTLREAWPDRQGFEHWFGFLNQWYLSGERQDGKLVLGAERHEDPWLMRDGDVGHHYQGFLDDLLTGEAISQVRELGAAGRPWFLNLWYFLPHSPLTPSAEYAAQYPDTTEGRYQAMVEHLDSNVGKVLRALADSGQERSTIVVFVSDNGAIAALGDSNAPFFGSKTTFFEGGLRTPLLIRWPDGAGAGSTDSRVTAIYDIYPTLLAHLGIPVPSALDGRVIGSGTSSPRDLYWETYARGHYGYSMLHRGGWRLYKVWPSTPWETPVLLFDVTAGTSAPRNLADQQPALFAQLELLRRERHRELHQLPLEHARDANGSRRITGLDFLRTPGFGGFTFAIAIGKGYAGRVAQQARVWQMELTQDGRLLVDIGGNQVDGNLAPAGRCHTAILSSWFGRRLSTLPAAQDQLELRLYLDGILADSQQAAQRIDDANFAAPTMVGDSSRSATNHLLGDPLILSAPIEGSDAWDVAQIHRELCARLDVQAGLQTK